MGEGVCRKKKLFTKKGRVELESLALDPWASRRRRELLQMLDQTDASLKEFDQAVAEQAEQNAAAVLLMTHPGVGPVTSLAFVLTMGDVSRFPRSKQVASYLGLIPREYSSGGKQRLGSISKQGNSFLRMLLVEAAQVAVRCDPQLRREYLHRCHHDKPKGVAKVAAARKLAVRLYWMLRTQKPYPEIVHVESSSRVPLASAS
jgi:transposase